MLFKCLNYECITLLKILRKKITFLWSNQVTAYEKNSLQIFVINNLEEKNVHIYVTSFP